MKKLILLATLIIGCSQFSIAQVKLGIKAGTSINTTDPADLFVKDLDGNSQLTLKLNEAGYGFHFGLVANVKLGPVFLQPELIFNSNSNKYEINQKRGNTVVTEILTEKYQYMDFPILVGVKLGPLKLGAGPVWHFNINSKTDLIKFDSYKENLEKTALGAQFLVGLNLGKYLIDVKYEYNSKKYGSDVSFENQTDSFDVDSGRLIASVGFFF